ncbi:MAG: dual specificity protein phosphatase family protein [Candidatus Binataceae bacterium]|jgi:protein-tyrosine phosphatase
MDWSVFNATPLNGVRSTRGDRPPSVTELLPELLIGEYPRVEDIGWLKTTHAVTAVHNLQDDDDLRIYGLNAAALADACAQASMRMVRTPIPDGSAHQFSMHLEPALAALRALTEAGERVYMHCNAGMNRAPTLAIAFMHACRGMSLDEALVHVKDRRACGPFMIVLEEYFGSRRRRPDK